MFPANSPRPSSLCKALFRQGGVCRAQLCSNRSQPSFSNRRRGRDRPACLGRTLRPFARRHLRGKTRSPSARSRGSSRAAGGGDRARQAEPVGKSRRLRLSCERCRVSTRRCQGMPASRHHCLNVPWTSNPNKASPAAILASASRCCSCAAGSTRRWPPRRCATPMPRSIMSAMTPLHWAWQGWLYHWSSTIDPSRKSSSKQHCR
jgi:hypothetical protein